MYKILIVDDDQNILDSLVLYFSEQGFDVLPAETYQKAVDIAGVVTLDAIILDVMLGNQSGFDACTAIRKKTTVPIIFLSALGSDENRIKGFLSGGDDYVTKPFSCIELELRLKNRIEAHKNKIKSVVYQSGGLTVDTGKRQVSFQGKNADLTMLEFDILALLASHPEEVFSYDMLYDSVWNTPGLKDRHTIQVHIARLRQKLKELSGNKDFIKTVSRHGYTFMPNG